ncbi:MAG: hypothetical protein LLF97_02600 [Planctomycetaceae bacterium]|nr:hypothetical protein [Planctomycetaceae bacterium]
MLDFRRHSADRNHARRKRRWRLLVLAFGLGAALIFIGRIRDRAFWQWLDTWAAPPKTQLPITTIDNRLAAVPPHNGQHGFHIEESPKNPAGRELAADLRNVQDDTPSSREEQAAAMRLLDILRRTNPTALQQQSVGPTSYAQLFREPGHYRGRVVTVSGVVRRVSLLELPHNDFHIARYYQVWLWPFDNPASPIVLYCLELPRGFPTGMTVAEDAAATGFFFKRCAYAAQDAVRTAPEILANTLVWQKQSKIVTARPSETWAIPMAGAAAVVLTLAVAYVVYLRTRPPRKRPPDETPSFDELP